MDANAETPPPALDPGLACLAMLAKFFEKAGDYDQLRHAHGDPAKPADEVDLLRYAKAIGFKAQGIDSEFAKLYRCLRSFRNKLEHRLLDRHLGEQLLRHALYGGYPEYPADRVRTSLDTLFDDLARQFSTAFEFHRNVTRTIMEQSVTIPILVKCRTSAQETWLALSSPIAPSVPVHDDIRALGATDAIPVVCVDDLLVRRHLPQAVQIALKSLR